MASASDEASVATSILSLYNLCIQSFDRLGRLLQHPDYDRAEQALASQTALEDELGRFRVWAANSGAHRKGRVSLDHKLREALHVHEKVTDLLGDLKRALEEGMKSVQHPRLV
jgi:hypothetical protein